jgi:hypothetical protein
MAASARIERVQRHEHVDEMLGRPDPGLGKSTVLYR